jgi:hypothetical protein
MGYQLVLYVHLCALFAAFSASTLLHFIEARECAAAGVAEVRDWHARLKNLVKVFPVAMITLLASGAYLVHAMWSWRMGWVQAGVLGLVLLIVNGPIIAGGRHRRIERYLEGNGDGAVTPELAAMLRDPVMRAATWANTALALGIALAMTLKTGQIASIAILLGAMLAGVALSAMRGPPPARAG